MIEHDKPILVLCNKSSLQFRSTFWVHGSILLVFTILLVIVMFTVVFPDTPWEQLLAKQQKNIGTVNWSHAFLKHLDGLAIFGLLFGQIWYLSRAQNLERLTLSPDGIRYTSPLPSSLKRLKPDWSISWDQIQKAELSLNGKLHQPNFVLLTFISASKKKRIFPCQWIDPENYSHPPARSWLTFKPLTQPRDEILKVVMESEVVRFLSKNVSHISIYPNLSPTETLTSLDKNPHGRIAIGIIFALLIYAIVDFIVGPESYLDDPLQLTYLYISAGIIGAIVSGIWLYKSALTFAEKVGLSILIGLLVSVAMLPGALRINAFTDKNGLTAYDYYVTQSSDGVVLKPVAAELPTIDYFAKNNFWEQFGKGGIYLVKIRKGGLGFYQFDSSSIIDDIHNHAEIGK